MPTRHVFQTTSHMQAHSRFLMDCGIGSFGLCKPSTPSLSRDQNIRTPYARDMHPARCRLVQLIRIIEETLGDWYRPRVCTNPEPPRVTITTLRPLASTCIHFHWDDFARDPHYLARIWWPRLHQTMMYVVVVADLACGVGRLSPWPCSTTYRYIWREGKCSPLGVGDIIRC